MTKKKPGDSYVPSDAQFVGFIYLLLPYKTSQMQVNIPYIGCLGTQSYPGIIAEATEIINPGTF